MLAIQLPRDHFWVLTLLTGGIAFILSAVLVPTVRKIATQLKVLDQPSQGKMHTGATPYFGGLAIGMAGLVIPSLFNSWSRDAAFVGLAAIMVSVTGLVDDLKNLHPAPRLGIEVVASLLAVHGGARVQIFNNWLDVVITVAWLVVITNSFNLMDNMDGVAATIAVATSSALLIAAVLQSQWLVAALSAGLVGACIGFLLYNWHPASIFMGDAGSLFLGFLLAVSAVKLRWNTGRVSGVVAVVLLMFPAVFDTALVVTSRTRAGRSIMLGGTDHTSHRLHRLGLPIPGVAALLGLVAIVCSALGVLVGRGLISPVGAVLPVSILAALTFARLIRMPVYTHGAGRLATKAVVATPLVAGDADGSKSR
jgi:UDP-GlcNAc:undecaprenyl-phosphate/decaprenyl-phosphate GlcNAc-1-phosphate transferase